MGFELQVIQTADPRRRLVLSLLREEDYPFLTICYEPACEGCLLSPVRYQGKADAITALNDLYPELAASDRRVVPAKPIIRQMEAH